MKAEDFMKMVRLKEDQERREAGARRNNTIWTEVPGFIGLEHMTPGAYLFRHELGMCWVPKTAVKFERKIDFDKSDSEYRIMIASWFDWNEKVKLMDQGKLVSDEYLQNRIQGERALKSVMPKVKTPKGSNVAKVPDENDFLKLTKEEQLNKLFEGLSVEEKSQPGGIPPPSMAPVRNRKRTKEENECNYKLKELKSDLTYFKINDSNTDLIMGVRKKMFFLIIEKKENGWTVSMREKKWFRKWSNRLESEKWEMEYDNGPESPDNLNRAIDL